VQSQFLAVSQSKGMSVAQAEQIKALNKKKNKKGKKALKGTVTNEA
jgi:hypothetical protein